MRITVPSLWSFRVGVFACAFLSSVLSGAEADTPYSRIAKLASFLTAGDTVGALEAFDKNMKGYAAMVEDMGALAAQTEVLCSIDVVEDKEASDETSDIHHLDLDWYMMVKSRADAGLVERRRRRVTVTFERHYVRSGRNYVGVWRITALSPEQILAPLAIR